MSIISRYLSTIHPKAIFRHYFTKCSERRVSVLVDVSLLLFVLGALVSFCIEFSLGFSSSYRYYLPILFEQSMLLSGITLTVHFVLYIAGKAFIFSLSITKRLIETTTKLS